jgi:hypothetical protein
MSNRLWGFALVAVTLLLGTLAAADPAMAGDGSVRFLSAGPVRLGDGHIGHMRVFLPAVQRPVHVHFLGEGGRLLKTLEVDPSDPSAAGPFFEVFIEITFESAGAQRIPGFNITDGTSNDFVAAPSGIIAILIGLPGPVRGGMGTLQVSDGAGNPLFILPYIEQDNIFRR